MQDLTCITRRLYVTNIQSDITEKQIRKVFGTIGKVAGCKIVEDKNLPNRIAAFVTYKKKSYVLTALENQKTLVVRGEQWYITVAPSKKHQLFIGGYDLNLSRKQLLSFFSYYGEVESLNMKFDANGVSRCFGFLTYKDSPDAAKILVQKRFIECLGKICEVKWAIPSNVPCRRPSKTHYHSTPEFAFPKIPKIALKRSDFPSKSRNQRSNSFPSKSRTPEQSPQLQERKPCHAESTKLYGEEYFQTE